MRPVVLCLVLLALVPGAASADAGDLKLVRSEQKTPRLTELTFTTPAVEGETHVRVLLPAGYDADSYEALPGPLPAPRRRRRLRVVDRQGRRRGDHRRTRR